MNKYLGMKLAALGLAFTSSFGLTGFLPETVQFVQPARATLIPSLSIKDTHQKQEDTKRVELNKEFDLKINQKAKLKEEALKITFVRVNEDSRCPANARCITAGKVVVVVNIVKNKQDLGEFVLTSNPAEPESAVQTFDGNFTIELVDVQPSSRMTSEEIKPSEYKVTLVVSKS